VRRIRRDPANPKLHALHVDIDENGTCSILAGNEGVIGVLPTLADLGLALAQRGLADQCDESIVGVVLTDDRDPTGATQVGCLARTTVGNEPDRPLVLIGVVQQSPHRPQIGEAILCRGCQPAIAHASDCLGRAGKPAVYLDGIALVFRS
jgi:hypothetical protein